MTLRIVVVSLFCAAFASGCLKDDKGKVSQDLAAEPDSTAADVPADLPAPTDVGTETQQDLGLPDLVSHDAADTTPDVPEEDADAPDTSVPDTVSDLPDNLTDTGDDQTTTPDAEETHVEIPDAQEVADLPDTTCQPDCVGKECGNDGCGGSCGTCPQIAPVCNASQLCDLACVPQCLGLECGPDGCGGTCGPCADGVECVAGYCQDGPCAGQDCSGHGVCSEAAGNVCVCDPGYHAEGWECLPGDFCFSGVFSVDQITYPMGAAQASGDFESLKGKSTFYEFCFTLNQAGESTCYNVEFITCMVYPFTVASANFTTDNQALLDFAQNIIGTTEKMEVHYINFATTFAGLNLVDGPAAGGAMGFEFTAQTFSGGQAWNDPVPGPFQMNNLSLRIRRYLGASMSDSVYASSTVMVE